MSGRPGTFDCSSLRAIRQRQHLTLREVGELAGIAASTVHRTETGKDATITTVVAIANALGYEIGLKYVPERREAARRLINERRNKDSSSPVPAPTPPTGTPRDGNDAA